MKKVDAILTSDWHLRETIPECRTDNFENAQWNKVQQVAALQEEYKCPVLHAGDLFHYWKASPFLISKTIQYLPKQFYTIYGQHDLPEHNFELREKTSIETLKRAKALTVVVPGSWGQKPNKEMIWPSQTKLVSIQHRFVWDGKKIPWPGCTEITAKDLLKKYKKFDLILTGDHHKPFVQELKGRLLVNPGCLTRQDASYINHKPRVYLWNADSNTVTPKYLTFEKDVISRVHLDRKKLKDQRIEAFINRISEDWELDLSFEENLKRFFSGNKKVKSSIKSLVYKSINYEKTETKQRIGK